MATSSTASADAILDAKPILGALRALGKGDFAVRLPMDQTGMAGAIAEAFNDIAQQIAESTDELDRISLAVGKEGKIDQRLSLGDATGGWAARVHSVNSLIGDLVEPTLEVARVIGAVAQGDLSQKMALGDRRPAAAGGVPADQRRPSTPWSTSSARSPRRSPAWPARSAPRASWAARPRCRASPAPGRTSPTASTPWPAT